MAGSARSSVAEVPESLAGIPAAGDRLVRGLWNEASALVTHGRGQASDLLAQARRLPADLRQRAQRVWHQLEGGEGNAIAVLAPGRLLQDLAGLLGVSSRVEVGTLAARIASLEQRLDVLEREAPDRTAASS